MKSGGTGALVLSQELRHWYQKRGYSREELVQRLGLTQEEVEALLEQEGALSSPLLEKLRELRERELETSLPDQLEHIVRGKRYNQGKLRYDLISFPALQEWVRVCTYGSYKYGDRNWEKGLPFMEILASALRHICSWAQGEDLDPESGLPHLAHALWNLAAILHFQALNRRDLDDRPRIISDVLGGENYGSAANGVGGKSAGSLVSGQRDSGAP